MKQITYYKGRTNFFKMVPPSIQLIFTDNYHLQIILKRVESKRKDKIILNIYIYNFNFQRWEVFYISDIPLDLFKQITKKELFVELL